MASIISLEVCKGVTQVKQRLLNCIAKSEGYSTNLINSKLEIMRKYHIVLFCIIYEKHLPNCRTKVR